MEGSARNNSFCKREYYSTTGPPFCALQLADGSAFSHLITGVTWNWTSPEIHNFLFSCTPMAFSSWCRTSWNNISVFNTSVMGQCHHVSPPWPFQSGPGEIEHEVKLLLLGRGMALVFWDSWSSLDTENGSVWNPICSIWNISTAISTFSLCPYSTPRTLLACDTLKCWMGRVERKYWLWWTVGEERTL